MSLLENYYNNSSFEQQEVVEQMKKIFSLVEDKEHWKNPIAKDIDLQSKEFKGITLGMIEEVVEFFTATFPTFTELGGSKYRVEAVGYFNGPAN